MDDWYWHFLGLQPGAGHHDIEQAHRRLAKLLHPDHGGTNEDMQRLNEAYELAKHAAPREATPATEKSTPTAKRNEDDPFPAWNKNRIAARAWKPHVLSLRTRNVFYFVIIAAVVLGAFTRLIGF